MSRHIRLLTRTSGPVPAQDSATAKIDANDLNFVVLVLQAVQQKKTRADTEPEDTSDTA